jgi:hypothetical protein
MPRSHENLDLLIGPPPEVLDQVADAWERAQEPLPDGLTLSFASEPALARAWGELLLGDGEVLAGISASDAIAIACGDALMAVAV